MHSETEADLFPRLVYFFTGILVTPALYMLLRRLQHCGGVETSRVTDDMCPVDEELLRGIVQLDLERRHNRWSAVVDSQIASSKIQNVLKRSRKLGIQTRSRRLNAPHTRRDVRVNVDRVTIQLRRILQNADRCRSWAQTDWRGCSDEIVAQVSQILEAEYETRKLARRMLFKIWLWNMTGFQRRTWGPVPNLQRLKIEEVLSAYERVKAKAISFADYLGERTVAQNLATSM